MMLQTAIEAARRAGLLIAERYPAERNVRSKGYRDVVTEVDLAAERIIIDLVHQRFPEHAIVSEEAGGHLSDSGYTWVIDPLDGTTNYSRRIPVCSVSVGVLERGEPLLGVVYDPLRDEMFVGEWGKGASVNGRPLQASDRDQVGHSIVGLDWGHADQDRQQIIAILNRVAPLCATVRGLGSAALALAYVAAGWLDAYVNLALQPWDAAAAVVLIAEAGGQCTTIDGASFQVSAPDCLATNGRLHAQLLSAIHSHSP
jgi:myo-inositol-1(or 4)-monophosphatase